VPVISYTLIGLCIVVFALQFFVGDLLTRELVFFPALIEYRPWTLLTSMFAHGSPIHLLANMFSLFMLGPTLELALGRVRYLALYFLSGLGGSIAVMVVMGDAGAVLGASGAIFGLLGALVVMIRRIGGNTTQLLIVVVLNLSIGFLVPSIAWEAHIGGLVVGALVALIYTRTQGPRNRTKQLVAMLSLTGALVLTTAIVAVIG
jgi:membrane associated rhomboid family serine protease